VDVRHLTVTAAELRDRPDAASLVDDELRPKTTSTTGLAPNEIMLSFVPVTFPAQVRCGEGSQAGFAIVWMGSCGVVPSVGSRTFGEGATFVIAHELVHALGAVPPCAPHYGRNGHVIDDPRDLLYDGASRAPYGTIELDPGHDDYYHTNKPDCPDIANHPRLDELARQRTKCRSERSRWRTLEAGTITVHRATGVALDGDLG